MPELAAPAVATPHVAAGVASPGDATPELWVIWMTGVADGHEHAVTDEQAVAGFELGHGTHSAVCGQAIAPRAMTDPPGRRCAACRLVSCPRSGRSHQATRWPRWLRPWC